MAPGIPGAMLFTVLFSSQAQPSNWNLFRRISYCYNNANHCKQHKQNYLIAKFTEELQILIDLSIND